jgi:uncharacterized small protein (DUF1192 family)
MGRRIMSEVEDMQHRLESTLDIVLDHFRETEERIAALEAEIEGLKNGIQEISN